MTDTWLKTINEGKLVGCAMIDFRKAFDLVDHQLLLKKLRIYQFSDMSLSWFKSYLSNRTQQVVINDCSSVNGDVLCGVPQGSILGPLLFLLFINDLPLSLNDSPISVDLYADDTTLYSSASDKTSLETNLQSVLDLVHIWCLENGMLINIEKTNLMLIVSRQKRHTLIDGNLKLEYNNLELRFLAMRKFWVFMWMKILSGITISSKFPKRYHHTCGCYLKFGLTLQSNIDCCTIMRI